MREECYPVTLEQRFSLTVFQIILKAVNSKDDFGRTPLYHACAGGHQRLLEELLNLGADPNAVCIIDFPSKEEG